MSLVDVWTVPSGGHAVLFPEGYEVGVVVVLFDEAGDTLGEIAGGAKTFAWFVEGCPF